LSFYRREDAYRIYVSRALEGLAGMNISYTSLFEPPAPELDAEEVKEDIKNGVNALRSR